MPMSSENIKRLDEIDLGVYEYEWTCPDCGYPNFEMDFGVKITMVKCDECDANFRVNPDYYEE